MNTGRACRLSIMLDEGELLRITKCESGEYSITGSQGVCVWGNGSERFIASYVTSMLTGHDIEHMVLTNNIFLPNIKPSTASNMVACVLERLEFVKHIVLLKGGPNS